MDIKHYLYSLLIFLFAAPMGVDAIPQNRSDHSIDELIAEKGDWKGRKDFRRRGDRDRWKGDRDFRYRYRYPAYYYQPYYRDRYYYRDYDRRDRRPYFYWGRDGFYIHWPRDKD